ncbi:MAG: class A beta-lactamase, partial [Pseudomonadota bacterium]|nr:class A beta-lactamase [Pseudomonadota bacterium]
MTRGADRRTVLTGLGALGVAGCSRAPVGPEAATPSPAPIAFDMSALEARHDGRLGFVAHDVGADARFSWRGDERFVYC